MAVAAVAILGVVAFGGWMLLGRATTPTAALGPPGFGEAAAAAGLDHTYDGDIRFFTGGGVAVFDCDGDMFPELYLAGGERPAALFHNVGGMTNRGIAFSPLTDPTTARTGVTGAYPLDVDGDGFVDLAVLTIDGATLLRGLGDCRFEPADDLWGFDGGGGWATAFSATWESDAVLPTLAIGRYQTLDAAGRPSFGCDDNLLVRPEPGAVARYAPPVVLSPGFCTLSMLFSDWDRSGRRDLRVSNDRQYYVGGQEQLWRVAPGEAPRLYTADDGWVSMQIWGMGIASRDLTGDGYPEVYLTSQGDNKLQTLTEGPGRPTYRDIALRLGVTAAQPATGGDFLPSTAWHPEFADVNNDGFVDLFVSKGNVFAQEGYALRDPSDLFLGQPDGSFVQAAEAAGILDFDRGRGAALVDLNLDGFLDLVKLNLGAPVDLWANAGRGPPFGGDPGRLEPAHWLAVRVSQPGPNRDAIGAWVEVRIGDLIQRLELTVGGGHVGGQLGWLHVGLGPSERAEVRVTWPDGEEGPWLGVSADGFYRVERGASEAVRLGGPGG